MFQAQQEVPNWLEEAATSSFGVGGFTGVGGKYGGRDTRKGRVRYTNKLTLQKIPNDYECHSLQALLKQCFMVKASHWMFGVLGWRLRDRYGLIIIVAWVTVRLFSVFRMYRNEMIVFLHEFTCALPMT